MKLFFRTFGLLALLLTQSCVQLAVKDRSYQASQKAQLNGADVTLGFKPLGGTSGFSLSAMVVSAAVGSTDGPFRWRVEAVGQEGVQEWLRVDSVQVATVKTKRREVFPKSLLGQKVPFVPLADKEKTSFAQFELPGKLTVKPEEDGEMTIKIKATVGTKNRTQSQLMTFVLNPRTKWKGETLFVPVELVKSFKKDPREWQWSSAKAARDNERLRSRSTEKELSNR